MITTKTLRDRWAYFKARYDMAERVAKNTQAANAFAEQALEKACLDTVAALEEESREQADQFRNWLVDQARAHRVAPDSLPPGDKRVDEAAGARKALAHVLTRWDSMQEEGADK